MKQSQPRIVYVVGGTAAASFHVSDTVDWSSLSAQTKNQVVVIEPRMNAPDAIITPFVRGGVRPIPNTS